MFRPAVSYGRTRYLNVWFKFFLLVVSIILLIVSIVLGCKGRGEVVALQNSERPSWSQSQESDLFVKFSKEAPIYQYYQKIPPMSGVTNDAENLIFNLRIELGYDVGNVKTLEKLSKLAIKIAGDLRQDLASKTKLYLKNPDNQGEIEKDILQLVNKIIAPDPRDENRVKDVIIAELQLHDYR